MRRRRNFPAACGGIAREIRRRSAVCGSQPAQRQHIEYCLGPCGLPEAHSMTLIPFCLAFWPGSVSLLPAVAPPTTAPWTAGPAPARACPGQPVPEFGRHDRERCRRRRHRRGGNGDARPNLTGLRARLPSSERAGGHPDFEAFSGSDASRRHRARHARHRQEARLQAAERAADRPQYGQQTTTRSVSTSGTATPMA